jgi:hypothetical protein
MAIKIREVAGMSGSEDGDQAEATLVYDIKKGASDTMAAVRAALVALSPTTFDGLGRTKFTWSEEEENLRLRASVLYTAKAPESTLRRSFDGTGGTIRIFMGHTATTRINPTAPPSGPAPVAPNYRGLINVKDGTPEGVDVTVPALKLVHSYKWPANVVTHAYCKALAGLVGTTNLAAYDTYAAGELLFLGFNCELVDGRPTDIQYHYAASADVTGITLAGFPSINKPGHDYLWIAYREAEDTAAERRATQPIGAYIERVYRRVSFSSFGYL